MMQHMHQLITNERSRSHLHHRLALCIIGLIALVHGKNGWIGEQGIFRGRVCITGATNYYTVVWHFVYNIFICIYLLIKIRWSNNYELHIDIVDNHITLYN